MWLIPYNCGEEHIITIDLGKMVNVAAIKFYNYNKSPEDSLRGAKTVIIKIDGNLVTPAKGLSLRKAPGFVLPADPQTSNDMGQLVQVPFNEGWNTHQIMALQKVNLPGIQQEYETVQMPVGFSFRLNLFSTYGDNFYIGLNGVELFDQTGSLIPVTPCLHVMVSPQSINSLPGLEGDVRTIDKLFNGNNRSFDERDMWLSPFKFTRSHAAANSASQNSEKREPNFILI
jgi:protein JBTS26